MTYHVEKKLDEVNRNTANRSMFVKRFFQWFNGFMVVKYLNNSHQDHYTKIPVEEGAGTLLQNAGVDTGGGKEALELLKIYRNMQRSQYYTIPL